ncbi:MAG: aminodeoxychorismate synthase component I [Proteobacteria bacterium]|nr:aminodeoxychorismate synthase component I [Pseudomonadota bacterium]
MPKYYRVKLKIKPDLIGLARCYKNKFPALLASNTKNEKTGRYSILFAKSKKSIRAFTPKQLSKLFRKIDKKITTHNTDVLPFHSGWFLYLSYASIINWEPSLAGIQRDSKQPLAIAIRCKSAIIIDHINNQYWLVGKSKKHINKLKKLIKQQQYQQVAFKNQLHLQQDDVQKYIKNVEKAKTYIKQGDVYQVNLARNWQVKSTTKIDALELYTTLSIHNPAPFAGFLQSKDFAIISSSPERLVKIENHIIESRPIAGTRPRHKDTKKDQDLLEELINHPKEQAEHIMLIDLERNDLGRVSKIGTVKVDEFMQVESYAKVHHIVSNVVAELAKDISFYDVIQATFPGGTITGCPKIRCMQIIDELEQQPRGAYTGSMGYITDDGKMDLNILIRTFALVKNQLSFHAGAGIVYDSIANSEAQESKHKAQALINSL